MAQEKKYGQHPHSEKSASQDKSMKHEKYGKSCEKDCDCCDKDCKCSDCGKCGDKDCK